MDAVLENLKCDSGLSVRGGVEAAREDTTHGPAAGAPSPEDSTPRPAAGALSPEREGARARAEQKLVARVLERCHAAIDEACKLSSVPAEFLGGLTANESGGNAAAARFEPAVYGHLAEVARGERPNYGAITFPTLARELDNVLHPKACEFHAEFLTPTFTENHAAALAPLQDEALRELATSWGFTQIMGYHVIGRGGFGSQAAQGDSEQEIQDSRSKIQDSKVSQGVRALLDPAVHFRVALELLAEFCHRFALDPRREFAEMFHCWNTGQPYGPPRGPATYDPRYVENGLRRMAVYKELAMENAHD